MRKLLAASTALVLIGSSVAFAAAPLTETGVISKIDTQAHTVTLASGSPAQFWLNQGVSAASLKVGEKVTITYQLQNGKAMASAVAAAM